MNTTSEIVETIVLDLTGETAIDHSTNLFDTGLLTSLDSLEMVRAIEVQLKLSVPDEELSAENFGTIASLVRLIDRLRGAAD